MYKRTILYLVGLTILAIGCWLIVALFFGFPGWGRQLLMTAGCWLAAVSLFWFARRLDHRAWLAAGFLVLAALLLPASVLIRIIPNDMSDPFGSNLLLIHFVVLSAALILAALLFANGRKLLELEQKADVGSQPSSPASRIPPASYLILSALLLAKAMHSLYQYTLWDNTYDSLGYICLSGPILAVFLAGFLLIVLLPGRTKLVGYLFLLMMPALLIAVSTLGQRVNFRQLTEVRASQVSRAIEAYYEDNGRYPQELHQLTPRYILSLPEPAIIFGQDWCFDSSGAEYVLGYVTCDHWSDPRLYGRIYSSTGGEGAEVKQPCEEEIAAMIARAPQYYELRRD